MSLPDRTSRRDFKRDLKRSATFILTPEPFAEQRQPICSDDDDDICSYRRPPLFRRNPRRRLFQAGSAVRRNRLRIVTDPEPVGQFYLMTNMITANNCARVLGREIEDLSEPRKRSSVLWGRIVINIVSNGRLSPGKIICRRTPVCGGRR